MSAPAYLGLTLVNGALEATYATERDTVINVPLTYGARRDLNDAAARDAVGRFALPKGVADAG